MGMEYTYDTKDTKDTKDGTMGDIHLILIIV